MADKRKALARNQVSDKRGAGATAGQDGSSQNQSVFIFKSIEGPKLLTHRCVIHETASARLHSYPDEQIVC